MATVFRKGQGFSGEYASADFPTLTSDWTGSVSIYSTYPGTAVDTWTLTRVGNVMTLTIPPEDIINLDTGVLTLVATISNAAFGVSISTVDYVTVTDMLISDRPMTKLFMTIGKRDGTPAGRSTRSLVNTSNGAIVRLGWEGISVTATYTVAETIDDVIWGVEKTETKTNAAGYAELFVLTGSVPTVSCPSFGKSVTVDTTGLDTIDLSTFF